MGRSAFTAKIVAPGKLDTQAARARVLNVSRGYQSRIEKDLKQITATWNHEVVFIRKPVQYAGGAILVEVYTDDKAFNLLDSGTRIRYATMTKPFRAKTRVRYIGSGPGVGRKAYVNRRRPRKGIEARHFYSTVSIEHQPDFATDIEKVLRGDLNTWARTVHTIRVG